MNAHAFRHFYGSHCTKSRRIWIVRPHEVPKTIQCGGIRHMDIKRSGSQPSGKGPTEYFTGAAHNQPLFAAPDPARASCGTVAFKADARTALHSDSLAM